MVEQRSEEEHVSAHQGEFGDYTIQGFRNKTATDELVGELSWNITSWNLKNSTTHHFRIVEGEFIDVHEDRPDIEDFVPISQIDPEERKQIMAAIAQWEDTE
jgi:hypothetical protein